MFIFNISEPVLCEGSPTIKILEDGWTVITEDGKRYHMYMFLLQIWFDVIIWCKLNRGQELGAEGHGRSAA